ncbi:septum formation inhibitor Maf [Helicobacter sp. 13S00477-4]|uniref:septum formation inhibitor Maf n=1 Tax=Helicobacter sp. 13S00477-4 TaxID=1905759 RepID=UPI000BA5E276|nr:septum formation inhibitor Maf [Helicobacter sp. 13S00477-4]PAF50548.1 septum formation inhibitor Maf [Helicobacter sp. 13S00477-4]
MIILASASPMRAKLLQKFGVEFIQKPLDFDEDSIKSTVPKEFVYIATLGKFKNALQHFGNDLPVLVADTVVSTSGKLQRKAKNISEARVFLQSQSNQNIEIFTCMMYKSKSLDFIDISSTKYTFSAFKSNHLQDYLNSKEWEGKAGCVMVEGFHKHYIKSQTGLESTALGLSVEKILPFLGIM